MTQVKETSNIMQLLKELKRDSLQPRHWIQIFNLIKAPHLKNSTTFTVINLREVHIENFQEEISEIIEQANTEMDYERKVKAIGEEWEELDLTIIPYKNNQDSYILINYETIFVIIEEHLTILESVENSMYAAHI